MATKPAPIYDESSEQALQRLIASLDARKKPLFDPVLLAMAEGFFSPTKTGGFGESIGIAAGKVKEAEAEQSKREIEDAKARMEIAQMRAQMERQRADWADMAPSTTLGAAPTGAQARAPEGAPAPSGQAVAVSGGMSKQEFLAKAYRAGMSRFDAEKAYDDYVLKGQKTTEGGTIDLRSGRFKPAPSADMVPYTVLDPDIIKFKDGRPQQVLIPKNIAIEANQALSDGDPVTYKKLIEPYARGFAAAAPSPAPSAAPDAGKPVVGTATASPGKEELKIETVAQKQERERKEKIEEAAALKTAEGMAARNVKETSEFLDAGVASRNLLPMYQRAETLVTTTPGIEDALGVLEKSGSIKSFIGSLAEEALRAGPVTIGIPSIRKSLTNMNVPQNVIDKVAELVQLAAMWQFEQRRGLGSGTSVSNFEQQMVNAMGPNITDSKESYLQKLRFMRNQAEFRAKLASELRARKMQYNEFEGTAEFQKMFEDYKQKQTSLVDSTTSQPQQPSGSWRHQRRQ